MSKNPTRTLGIEKSWGREINKRWSALAKEIRAWFENQPVVNEVPTDTQQVRVFMAFLNTQIENILLAGGNNWQAKYQLQSYERALQRTRASLKAQGAVMAVTPEDFQMAAQINPEQFTATATLATASVANKAPIHRDALEFLFTRSYESLEGWTSKFSTETRQILMEGIQQGRNTRDVARDIMKRLNVSRSRARVIATTETIQAYQQSSSNEATRAQEELGEEIGMRWQSAEDSRVRELHARWNGTVVSQQQNARRIVASVFNCRCSQAPVLMRIKQ